MYNNNTLITSYLAECRNQKRLDSKTLKAYQIDLKQFTQFFSSENTVRLSSANLESYIHYLHQTYKPKTVKRKLASLKAFYHYLEYKNIIDINPFNRMRISFRQPIVLPKTIPLHTVELLLTTMYEQYAKAPTAYRKKRTLLDIAVCEMLFSTGMRISELCNLHFTDVDLIDSTITIYGKGAKERRIQLGNKNVVALLRDYVSHYQTEISKSGYFFSTPHATNLSDQSVRRMLNKYCKLSSIHLHITPHMIRHTFATCLLEADVDIRYIQEMLGHSSITVTEIYTHVALSKQKAILEEKHPRKTFRC